MVCSFEILRTQKSKKQWNWRKQLNLSQWIYSVGFSLFLLAASSWSSSSLSSWYKNSHGIALGKSNDIYLRFSTNRLRLIHHTIYAAIESKQWKYRISKGVLWVRHVHDLCKQYNNNNAMVKDKMNTNKFMEFVAGKTFVLSESMISIEMFALANTVL